MVKNRYNIVNEETNQIICKAKTGGRHYRQNKDAIQDGMVPVSTTIGRAQKEAEILNTQYYQGWEVVPDPANSGFVDSAYDTIVKDTATQYKNFMILSIMEMYKYGEIDDEQKDLLLHHNYEVYRGFVEVEND
jgi:hypothetical protein